MDFSQTVLNRSISAPDLSNDEINSSVDATVRRIFVSETTYFKDRLDQRYFSCETIYYGNLKKYPGQKHLDLESLKSPQKWKSYENRENIEYTPTSIGETIVPMEIDLSDDAKSENTKDDVSVDTVKATIAEIIHKNARLSKRREHEIPDTANFYASTVVFSFIFLVLALVAIHSKDVSTRVNINLKENDLELKLLSRVFRQTTAVQSVINSLKSQKAWSNNIKFLVFTGGTGVGKTYITNVIKGHFPLYLTHDINLQVLENEKEQKELIAKLDTENLNVFIFDDMTYENIDELFYFVNKISSDVQLLIFSIFNISDLADDLLYYINSNKLENIISIFKKAGVFHEINIFHDFNENDAREWLNKYHFNTTYKIENFKTAVEKVIRDHDVKSYGFKGLHSKFLLEITPYL